LWEGALTAVGWDLGEIKVSIYILRAYVQLWQLF